MAIEEIGLRHGRLRSLDADMKIGIVDIREGDDSTPPEVIVFIKDDGEHDFTLRPGETFPIGDQTWKFDRVKGSGGGNLTAVFARIE